VKPRRITIWKYALPAYGAVTHAMPDGAVPLSVGVQDGAAVVWMQVDPSQPKVDRSFVVRLTGGTLFEAAGIFIGTFQLEEDLESMSLGDRHRRHVGHVFDLGVQRKF
jgi:hypothetical protein